MATSRTIVIAGRLIDGTGAPVREQVALIAAGGTIQEVVPAAAARPVPGDVVVDAAGATVLPGLIDAHIHIQSDGTPGAWAASVLAESVPSLTFQALDHARRALRMGYTALRDLGCRDYVDVALRDAIEAGEVDGPRLRVSGMALSMSGGHFAPRVRRDVAIPGYEHCIVNTASEARAGARYQLAMGADIVKMSTAHSELSPLTGEVVCHPELGYDMIAAAVAQARKIGRLTAAHCHGGEGASDSIRAGVDSIEHGHWLTEAQFAEMAERGITYVPTFCPNSEPAELARQGLHQLSAWRQRCLADKQETFARAMRSGVKIAAGSDAGFDHVHHGRNARELMFMVEAGMSPLQAIRAATQVAAEVMGLGERTGTLQPGRWLDAVVVSGDPLADIRVLQDPARIQVVIQGGRLLVDGRGRSETELARALRAPQMTDRGAA